MPATMPQQQACEILARAPERPLACWQDRRGRLAITRMPGWLDDMSTKGRSPSKPSVRVIAIIPVPTSTLMYLSGNSTSISMSSAPHDGRRPAPP